MTGQKSINIPREKIENFRDIIKKEELNNYIRTKIDIVNTAIETILKGQEQNEYIEIPQRIDFQNLLKVLEFFFWNKDINTLNWYWIYFVLNFLKCCDTRTFENISIEDVKNSISKKALEKLIWNGEKWEKEREKRSLRELGLWEILDKFNL
jgi:hypothetical protein